MADQQASLSSTSHLVMNATSSLLDPVKALGLPSTSFASAKYGWTDLGVSDDNSGVAPLTNSECAVFSASVTNQATLALSLAAELAKALPVLPANLTIQSPITCAPRRPMQTRPDQVAVFTISDINLVAISTLFAANADYVTMPAASSVGSFTEANSPLSVRAVRSALQNALRRIFLTAYRNALSMSIRLVFFFPLLLRIIAA